MTVVEKLQKKIKGLEDELKYCIYKADSHPSPHWRIRELEIEEELKALKRKMRTVARKK